jgi:nitroimidazol reductase NimA-like FMN-containing flavoprotein (pyridoxamine 5'-phosphate oxidase superfamily)
MPHPDPPAEIAQAIVARERYMTLATADADGEPWASPVWFAPDGSGGFVWVSAPEARHSRNIAARPQVAIVIFDSHIRPGEGEGVYLSATAAEVDPTALDEPLAAYAARSRAQGLADWSRADVLPPARHRLYRATPTAAYLGRHDTRTPIPTVGGG